MQSKKINSFKGFLNSNLNTIYEKTGSYDVEKYMNLLNKIIKIRLKTGTTTKIDFKNKKIVIKTKKLSNLNFLGLNYAVNNQAEMRLIIQQWLENRGEIDKKYNKINTSFKF